MEQSLIMSLHKEQINAGLTMTITAAIVFLAGALMSPLTVKAEAATGLSLAGSAAAAQTSGDRVLLADNHPEEYVVQKGDTLWDISKMFLKDPWYWPEIWQVNPQIANPHLIYPGDVLVLIYVDGQPRLFNRGSAERLSPQIRTTQIEAAIVSIPYDQIAAFLSRGLVIEKSEIGALPYMLATRGDHLIAGAGNDVYVRGNVSDVGTRYSVVHIGDELVDPDDNSVVGFQGIYVGEGMVRRGGDPATVRLIDTNREALQGDRLIPESIEIPLTFFPKSPASTIDGRIISVVDGVSLIGQYQVVVINRGTRDNLANGDVLTVFQSGDVVKDRFAGGKLRGGALLGGESVKLPDEEAGTVMVFKVYDRIAYALVMEATSEIRVYDAVRNPS
jgi:hypothetical protein